MVHRLLGLERLPDVATVSRTLAALDATGVANLRRLVRQRVLDQLGALGLARVTLDFDGSVLSTGRFAEGTAVGFNRKKKCQRSRGFRGHGRRCNGAQYPGHARTGLSPAAANPRGDRTAGGAHRHQPLPCRPYLRPAGIQGACWKSAGMGAGARIGRRNRRQPGRGCTASPGAATRGAVSMGG